MKTATQATKQTTTVELYAASCNDCKRTIEYDDGRAVKGGAHTISRDKYKGLAEEGEQAVSERDILLATLCRALDISERDWQLASGHADPLAMLQSLRRRVA